VFEFAKAWQMSSWVGMRMSRRCVLRMLNIEVPWLHKSENGKYWLGSSVLSNSVPWSQKMTVRIAENDCLKMRPRLCLETQL